jgi:hypothetical protein
LLSSLSEKNLISVLNDATNKFNHQDDMDRTISTLSEQMSEQCNENLIHINSCNYTPSLHSKKNTFTHFAKVTKTNDFTTTKASQIENIK